jgi:hypothetical protein
MQKVIRFGVIGCGLMGREFASAAAACNLFAANSVDGMRPKHEILQIAEKYGRMEA